MALNFPNSPTNGQLYTDTMSGNSWTWDSANTCWKSTSTYIQTITVASSAPGTPAVGQLWWNQDYGRLLVYYNDGTSSQWVDASPSDYTSQLAYNQANAAYGQANSFVGVYAVANAAFGVANTALANTSGVTFAGDLTITGNTTIKKKTVVNYTPATADNAAVYIATANTQGGTGYADFLKVNNIAGGTNPHKTFRLNSTGGIEVINSAYTANLLTLSNEGYLTLPQHPAFHVYDTVGTDFASESKNTNLVNVSWNNGSYYNTSTQKFTAPVAGYYYFYYRTNMSNTRNPKQVVIYVNGSPKLRGYNYDTVTWSETAAIGIWYLAVNDYVEFYYQGDPDAGLTWNAAGGYLIG